MEKDTSIINILKYLFTTPKYIALFLIMLLIGSVVGFVWGYNSYSDVNQRDYNLFPTDDHPRQGDYWYSAPDGTYWAQTAEINANSTTRLAYFTACPCAPTQLHCGPFGWNATENFEHPYGNSSELIHMIVVNNTIVSVSYG